MNDSLPNDYDYRASHLDKGASYDGRLAGSPFDAYMSYWERRHIPSIVKSFFPSGLSRYLDFACGTGRITEQIAALAHQALAVDISPSMLDEARQKCPNVTFILGDITREDPSIGQFDLVSSFRFFGNAQDSLREAALDAIAKRVKPGGYLLINNHRNPRALYSLLDRLTGGDAGTMDLHLSKLNGLLSRHGFDTVHRQPIGTWLYRARLMSEMRPDQAISARMERRFSRAFLASISPDVIIMARKR